MATSATPGAAAQPAPLEAVPAAQAGETISVVVRPVSTNGRPAAGWKVKRQNARVSCDSASRSAVDAGIVECYPTNVYVPACWKSTGKTVLCLRDVRARQLVRLKLSGAFPKVRPIDKPQPQALDLVSGTKCQVRIGGAWGTVPDHPDWVGYYSCTQGAIYGPTSSADGIDRSEPVWRVQLLDFATDKTTTETVRTAYFVGNAA